MQSIGRAAHPDISDSDGYGNCYTKYGFDRMYHTGQRDRQAQTYGNAIANPIRACDNPKQGD
jgi:hypothetical protein